MVGSPAATPEEPQFTCEGCGYDLHGLADHHCPECGLHFDADQPPRGRRPLAPPAESGEPRGVGVRANGAGGGPSPAPLLSVVAVLLRL